jgi:hypothetical protein
LGYWGSYLAVLLSDSSWYRSGDDVMRPEEGREVTRPRGRIPRRGGRTRCG